MICSSGGSRGSGLYIVASHGGSPSGRLIAVLGLSVSPDRVPGLTTGEEFEVVAALVFVVFDTLRVVGVVFRAVLVTGVPVGLFTGFAFVGDPCTLDFPAAAFPGAGVGVPFTGSPSSGDT